MMKSLEVIEIQNMMGITDVQPQWFINFLKKTLLAPLVMLLKVKLCQTNVSLKNYTSQLLEK